GLNLYDMDRTTGLLSTFRKMPLAIDSTDFVGGLAYSPSGQFLYVCNWNKLYQFDLLANDIPSSIELVGVFDGFGDPFPLLFFFMQETPDGRVFISTRNGSRYYHAIQEPNKKGLSCRFEQHTIQCPTYNNSTIPRFPNY